MEIGEPFSKKVLQSSKKIYGIRQISVSRNSLGETDRTKGISPVVLKLMTTVGSKFATGNRRCQSGTTHPYGSNCDWILVPSRILRQSRDAGLHSHLVWSMG